MKPLLNEQHRNIDGLFNKYEAILDVSRTILTTGEVFKVEGLLIVCRGPMSQIRELCEIHLPGGKIALAEVVAFSEEDVKLMPLESVEGIVPGCKVYSRGLPLEIKMGPELLGRVLSATGEPLDNRLLNFFHKKLPVVNKPPDILKRKRIKEILPVGIKAIDGLLTVGKGQRLGIFSGTGVGKSTLLSMITRNASADINVVALIGERGRELLDFIERDLGEEGLKKSVIVVATADSPPMARVRCLYVATSIAEYFRDEGKDVLLMVDSITRMAMAQREIGASLREPPTMKGYPPSVFSMLPSLLERAGTSQTGSITAFYNVLIEGDDEEDPIVDALRGVVDGHIFLSRQLANQSYYPAIDVTKSLSRLMKDIVDEDHEIAGAKTKEWVAHYQSVKDLLQVGAYVRGENSVVDEAISKQPDIENFLKQGTYEVSDFLKTKEALYTIVFGANKARALLSKDSRAGGTGEHAPRTTVPAGLLHR